MKETTEINSCKETIISYELAVKEIRKRFPKTTIAEFSIWCFLGKEDGGLDSIGESFHANPRAINAPYEFYTKHEFYLEEVKKFTPIHRYLLYIELIDRWSKMNLVTSPEKLIEDSYAMGKLSDMNPFAGSSDTYELMIFKMSEIEGIEASNELEFIMNSQEPNVGQSSTAKPFAGNEESAKSNLSKVHRLKNRVSFLSAEIEQARSIAIDRNDAPQDRMKSRRQQSLDENSFRGSKRLIIENWDDIERLHGTTADGIKVLRVLQRNKTDMDKMPTLKTVQNSLIQLRDAGLIP